MSDDVASRSTRRPLGASRDAAPSVPEGPPSTDAPPVRVDRRMTARRGVVIAVAAGLVGLLVVAVATLAGGEAQPNTVSSATVASSLPTQTSGGPDAGPSTTSQAAAPTTLMSSLPTVLPDWNVTRVSRVQLSSSGWGTTQRWAVRDVDGVSYSQMVEITIFPVNGDPPDSPLVWHFGAGPDVRFGSWVAAGHQHDVYAYGLTTDDASAFIATLALRDPQQPLQGYDAAPSALELVEEEIGSNFDAVIDVPNVSIELERADGATVTIGVIGRDRLPLAIDGIAARRAQLDRHVALVSAPDADDTEVRWTQDGAQVSVTTRLPLDEALALAERVEQLAPRDLLELPSS